MTQGREARSPARGGVIETVYEVKVTWMEHGTRNAACIGNDESLSIEAGSVREALREAADGHMYRYEEDWNTGKYDLVAEHVDGSEVYGVEFCAE